MRRLAPLIFIVAIGFALRVHLLGHQELRGDEGFTWNYIQKPPLEIVATIIREGDPQPPLHYWLQWAWAQFTGDTEFAMRAWSALLSLLLAPLVYQVGRKLWRDEVGVIAAGLTAIHPQQVWLAQDARNMYQLALIALLIAAYLLPELIRRTSRAHWLGYVACGVVAMYSHYYSLFFLLAHGAYVFTLSPVPRVVRGTGEGRGGGRDWLAAGLAIAALVAPWAIVILPVYSRGQLADPGSLSFLRYTASMVGDLTAGPAFPESAKLIVALAFAALCTLAILFTTQPPNHPTIQPPNHPTAQPPTLYLLSAILIPFIGIYAIVAARATLNTFYFVFAFPAAYLLAAGGAHTLLKRNRLIGAGIAILAVITFGIGLNNHYRNPQYSKTRGMRELAARLAQASQPGDIYLANTPDPAQVYYLRRLGLPFHMQPGSPNFNAEALNAEIDSLLAHRLWFAPARTAQDPTGYVEQRLLNTAILAEDDRFGKMRLMLFLPPTASIPINARFADGIRLVGYYLTANRLTLAWAADSTPSADYTVFVHALAADTFNLSGHDSPPHIPTSQWQPGQLIVDTHEFDIPIDQPVTLVAGMYLPATGDRLALETESFGEPDAAMVTTINP
ncbi:MAG: phospholipid carrier-dependent glycosyltransferase [Chloroflexi bacterium]|nr:phospholipid carrier-dependent glycosyltransferase [Chloroflexota bacterium]